MKPNLLNLGWFIFFLIGNVNLAIAAPASYNFTDLGTLGGTSSWATAINNLGQVAGWTETASGERHAAVWNGGKWIDLGTGGGNSSVANDINDTGQVIGEVSLGSGTSQAVLWNGTKSIELANPSGAVSSSAYGINNMGEIAGSAALASEQSHAVVWKDGKAIDLGAQYAGNSYANGINNMGQVVGGALSAVIVWNDNKGTRIAEGYDRGCYSCGDQLEEHLRVWPAAINDLGQIVGSADYSWQYQGEGPWFQTGAVVWNDPTREGLGALPPPDPNYPVRAEAHAINNLGQVVGQSYHAVLWNETSPIDLNSFLDSSKVSEGWKLTSATGINDHGWIVGQAINSSGNAHAFLLTPVSEPETYAMLLAGLSLLTFLAKSSSRSRQSWLPLFEQRPQFFKWNLC